jgi:hypothetical protein
VSKGLSNKGFDIDLETGQFSEGVLADILRREGRYIEVKSDAQCSKTGNVYIEYESRGKPSGISTTEAQWWALEFRPMRYILITLSDLKAIAAEVYMKKGPIAGGDYDTSKGVLIPVDRLLGR